MNFKPLFSQSKLGELQLPHRIVMAPLTRFRALTPDDISRDINVEYYSQWASDAFISSEASLISPQGKGCALTVGFHSNDQNKSWKRITDIFTQLK